MDIFVVLYLIVIIAALVLILVLATKKERFSSSTPLELRCKNKEVEITQPEPILYYYYAGDTCKPSQEFMDIILTPDKTANFDSVKHINLSDFNSSLPDLFPYIDKISFTPSIIVEYQYIINDTIKEKIFSLQNSDKGIEVENIDGTKHIIVISNLDEYTPDDSDLADERQGKHDSFSTLLNSMIITR